VRLRALAKIGCGFRSVGSRVAAAAGLHLRLERFREGRTIKDIRSDSKKGLAKPIE
jgi:hypothetical protein